MITSHQWESSPAWWSSEGELPGYSARCAPRKSARNFKSPFSKELNPSARSDIGISYTHPVIQLTRWSSLTNDFDDSLSVRAAGPHIRGRALQRYHRPQPPATGQCLFYDFPTSPERHSQQAIHHVFFLFDTLSSPPVCPACSCLLACAYVHSDRQS